MTGAYKELYRMVCAPPGRKPSHAASIPHEGAVVLCPRFWNERDFPSVEDCTGVVGRRGNRRFVDSGRELSDTKFPILIHELIHLYNPLDGAAKKAEVYIAQDCVDLDGKESVSNAKNWALYAACKRSDCFPLVLSFPQMCQFGITSSFALCLLSQRLAPAAYRKLAVVYSCGRQMHQISYFANIWGT